MPAHGIDEQITDLEIKVDPGGLTGTVRADGRNAPRAGDVLPLTPRSSTRTRLVMNLELVHRTGTIVRAPATVAEPARPAGGGEYTAGQPWGTFTFAGSDAMSRGAVVVLALAVGSLFPSAAAAADALHDHRHREGGQGAAGRGGDACARPATPRATAARSRSR